MTHSELMQYANAFFMAHKLFPAEIEGLIAREAATSEPNGFRLQAYANILIAQRANSMAAIADVVVAS